MGTLEGKLAKVRVEEIKPNIAIARLDGQPILVSNSRVDEGEECIVRISTKQREGNDPISEFISSDTDQLKVDVLEPHEYILLAHWRGRTSVSGLPSISKIKKQYRPGGIDYFIYFEGDYRSKGGKYKIGSRHQEGIDSSLRRLLLHIDTSLPDPTESARLILFESSYDLGSIKKDIRKEGLVPVLLDPPGRRLKGELAGLEGGLITVILTGQQGDDGFRGGYWRENPILVRANPRIGAGMHTVRLDLTQNHDLPFAHHVAVGADQMKKDSVRAGAYVLVGRRGLADKREMRIIKQIYPVGNVHSAVYVEEGYSAEEGRWFLDQRTAHQIPEDMPTGKVLKTKMDPKYGARIVVAQTDNAKRRVIKEIRAANLVTLQMYRQ